MLVRRDDEDFVCARELSAGACMIVTASKVKVPTSPKTREKWGTLRISEQLQTFFTCLSSE